MMLIVPEQQAPPLRKNTPALLVSPLQTCRLLCMNMQKYSLLLANPGVAEVSAQGAYENILLCVSL